MYGIFTYIYHILPLKKQPPNVRKYTVRPMDSVWVERPHEGFVESPWSEGVPKLICNHFHGDNKWRSWAPMDERGVKLMNLWFLWEFLHQTASLFLGYIVQYVCPLTFKNTHSSWKDSVKLQDENKHSWTYSAKVDLNPDGLQKTWNDDMTLASCSTHQIILMKERFKLLTQDASAMFTNAAIKRQNCLVYQKPVGIFQKKSKTSSI